MPQFRRPDGGNAQERSGGREVFLKLATTCEDIVAREKHPDVLFSKWKKSSGVVGQSLDVVRMSRDHGSLWPSEKAPVSLVLLFTFLVYSREDKIARGTSIDGVCC
jgi:hypothetical protein